jgi:hAT family C-terminal dimerisation region
VCTRSRFIERPPLHPDSLALHSSEEDESDDDEQKNNADIIADQQIKSELLGYDMYKCGDADKIILHDHGLLFWWKIKQGDFPVISRVVRSVLAVPASSAKSECNFSDAGNTMTKKRNQLDPTKLDDLMFLRSMLKSKLK